MGYIWWSSMHKGEAKSGQGPVIKGELKSSRGFGKMRVVIESF